jgi:formylglycine-generating enzyme required for sulfatase activity
MAGRSRRSFIEEVIRALAQSLGNFYREAYAPPARTRESEAQKKLALIEQRLAALEDEKRVTLEQLQQAELDRATIRARLEQLEQRLVVQGSEILEQLDSLKESLKPEDVPGWKAALDQLKFLLLPAGFVGATLVAKWIEDEVYPSFMDALQPLVERADQVLHQFTLPAPPPQPDPSTQPRLFRPTSSLEPALIHIPVGRFLMGSDPNVDKDAREAEQPQHSLYLPDYYIAQTPITNAQYFVFVRDTDYREIPYGWEGGRIPRGKEDHPVRGVTWYNARAYCQWLSNVTGKMYRLPSEAEWEKAARGTDGRIYPWGNRWDPRRCNSDERGIHDTTPVGAYPEGASPYGVLDMAGNVWEWTCSLWGKAWEVPAFGYPYEPADGREDLDVPAEVFRVLRGGSGWAGPTWARCAARAGNDAYLRYASFGLRVVLSHLS